jgi:hypothetical protein
MRGTPRANRASGSAKAIWFVAVELERRSADVIRCRYYLAFTTSLGVMEEEKEAIPTLADTRFAQLASVLAAAVRLEQLDETYALRVLRHQLRLFNRNKAVRVVRRSVGASDVVERYERDQLPIPKNGSPDALHADHVHPLDGRLMHALHTPSDWLANLDQLREVVCVTAAENEQLRRVEAEGTAGWEKYVRADIQLHELAGESWIPLDLVASGLVADELTDAEGRE